MSWRHHVHVRIHTHIFDNYAGKSGSSGSYTKLPQLCHLPNQIAKKVVSFTFTWQFFVTIIFEHNKGKFWQKVVFDIKNKTTTTTKTKQNNKRTYILIVHKHERILAQRFFAFYIFAKMRSKTKHNICPKAQLTWMGQTDKWLLYTIL